MTGMPPQDDILKATKASSWMLHPWLLMVVYIGLVLAPIGIAYAQDFPPRNWQDELSSALALVAFAGLLVEFMLSGRFRLISGRIGIDTTMRFHQLMARSFAVFILVHPFFYITPTMNHPLPWDETGQYTLGLTAASFVTGIIAWLALFVLIVIAIFRDRCGFSYEAWRLSHGGAAVAVAVIGVLHTFNAGRYSNDPVLSAYWLVLLGVAIFTLVWVYALKPFWLRRNPYAVRSVRQIARKTWELVVAPEKGAVIPFSAGQFVWLKVGRSPFSICENPFSIASSPTSGDHLSFVIKETGDFTRGIGQITPGAIAYVDGPHGNLTLDDVNGTGIALIAGGVGIAPLLGILRQLYHEQDKRPIVLLYGNRLEDQIVYAAELQEMQKSLDLRLEYFLGEPSPDWQGRTGVIDADAVTDILDQSGAENWAYFICGPLPMVESVEAALLAMNVPGRQIISERFYYD